MTVNEESYERVARRLDGEEIALSPEERALAEEIARDEAALADSLDVRAPQAAIDRARRRMTAEMGRPSLHLLRRIAWTAAAAAAILVVAVLAWHSPDKTTVPTASARHVSAEPDDATVDLVSRQVEDADVVVQPPAAMDLRMEFVQQSINDFWTDELAATSPGS
jgi:hypothetical protein